jgi:hypothetical protein
VVEAAVEFFAGVRGGRVGALCEQMMIEALREGNLVKLRRRRPSSAWRASWWHRLHAEDMSVEAGMRFFRDEAFMVRRARREAERGTFVRPT